MEKLLGMPINIWANIVLDFLDICSVLSLREVSKHFHAKATQVLQIYYTLIQASISEIHSSPQYANAEQLIAAGTSTAADFIDMLTRFNFFELRYCLNLPVQLEASFEPMIIVITGKSSATARLDIIHGYARPDVVAKHIRELKELPDLEKVEKFVKDYSENEMRGKSIMGWRFYQCLQTIVQTAKEIPAGFKENQQKVKRLERWEKALSRLWEIQDNQRSLISNTKIE